MSFLGFGKDFLKSRKQVEKERKEFEKKIFPFEEQHRLLVAAVLKEQLNPKLGSQEIMFAFVCAKQAYLEADQDDEQDGRISALRSLREQRWISKKEADFIVALVMLDALLLDISSFPTKEEVLIKVESIAMVI